MATATAKPDLNFKATFTIDEGEARALDALIGYGGKALLEAAKGMGIAYMSGHEDDLVRFAESLRMPLASVLHQFDNARKEFFPVPKQ